MAKYFCRKSTAFASSNSCSMFWIQNGKVYGFKRNCMELWNEFPPKILKLFAKAADVTMDFILIFKKNQAIVDVMQSPQVLFYDLKGNSFG
jgi:hypothetical protein